MTQATRPAGLAEVAIDRPRGRVLGSGQSLTEFALILPVFMLIFMGIIQFGFTFSGQIGLVNAVREAARYGSVSQTTAANATSNGNAVRAYLVNNLLPGNVTGYSAANLASADVCYIGYQDPGNSPATYSVRMTVTVTYRHPLFVPMIATIIDGFDGTTDDRFRVTVSEQFRVENIPQSSDSFGGTARGTSGC